MNAAPSPWASVPPPASYADLRAHYGNPDTDPHFESTYIVSRLLTLDSGQVVHVRSHVAVADRLGRVFAALKGSGHLQDVHTEDGCFNIRRVRGMAALSLHSWGLAIDVNAGTFPLGSVGRQPSALVAAFAAESFKNGADYKHRKDPMHFEFCRDLF